MFEIKLVLATILSLYELTLADSKPEYLAIKITATQAKPTFVG